MRSSGKAFCGKALWALSGLCVACVAQAGVIPGDIERSTRVKLGTSSAVEEQSDETGVFDSNVISIVSLDSARAQQTSDEQGNSWSGSMFSGAQVVSVSPVGTASTMFKYEFELIESTMVMIDASSSGATDGFEPEVTLDSSIGNIFSWTIDPSNPRSINAMLLPGTYTFEASIFGVVSRPGSFESSLMFSGLLDAPVIVPTPASGALLGLGLAAAIRRRRA
ncbi:MAG: hypothetical protein AAGK04_00770 [Planctomycetota bacterium]